MILLCEATMQDYLHVKTMLIQPEIIILYNI